MRTVMVLPVTSMSGRHVRDVVVKATTHPEIESYTVDEEVIDSPSGTIRPSTFLTSAEAFQNAFLRAGWSMEVTEETNIHGS